MSERTFLPAEIRDVLIDITRTQVGVLPTSVGAGPNDWDNIQAEDFGPEADFELHDHGSVWIFYPISNAALQWCYAKLPSDCPRWGAKGFAIEGHYISLIVDAARSDGLMSEEDFEWAMEEANAIQHQGVES